MKDYSLLNCTILDGTKDMKPQENMTIIVKEGVISAIEHNGNPVGGTTFIDMKGKYVMPGLINMHVHLPGTGKSLDSGLAKMVMEPGEEGFLKKLVKRSLKKGLIHNYLASMVKKNAINALNSGVTTMRTVGELSWTDSEVKELFKEGDIIGPRILNSGLAVGVVDGHMAGKMAAECSSIKECEEVVQEAYDRGADWIKLMITGGVLDASDDGEPARLRMCQEYVTASCNKAHKLGKKVAAHVESSEGVKVALNGGVDTIEHGARMNEELIKLYKDTGAAVIVTISPAVAISDLPMEMTGINDKQRDAARYVMEGIIESGKIALKEGIPVGLGTDSSCPFVTHYDMWRELYYAKKYLQITNEDVIYLATLGNAKILGINDITGSIEVGKCADLLITRNNPLDDITVLRDAYAVMTAGRYIREPKVKRIKEIDEELDKVM